jgi:hypothetical protein
MGSTQAIAKFLTHGRWTGQEAARLILSAAEDLACGREPVFTEAEATRLRKSLAPGEAQVYWAWVGGYVALEDLLGEVHVMALEAQRVLLTAETLLLHAFYRARLRIEALQAGDETPTPLDGLAGDLAAYINLRIKPLLWFATVAESYRARVGLPPLALMQRLDTWRAEVEQCVVQLNALIALARRLDINDVAPVAAVETCRPTAEEVRQIDALLDGCLRSGGWDPLRAALAAQTIPEG